MPPPRRMTATVGQRMVTFPSPRGSARLRSSRTRSRHGATRLEHSTSAAASRPPLVLAARTRISDVGMAPQRTARVPPSSAGDRIDHCLHETYDYHRLREGLVRRASFLLLSGLVVAAANCRAFEGDVHYGMTLWLALKAGFNEREAATIATGSQRVDAGDMQYVDVGLMYACLGKDDAGAKRAGADHYPTAAPVPGPADARAVVAGGDAARKAAIAMTKVPPDKSGFMLLKLGEALHILQDSWAHQGVPDTPLGASTGIECGEARACGHPKARGGAQSHRADLTHHWPDDTLAAAKATYDVLQQFAPVGGVKRTPQSWDEIKPRLDGFIKAATKSQKRDWFAAEGMADVSFLEGVSLPDGAKPFDLVWGGRRLPPVPTHQSRQHHVDSALLDFFHAFFERWMTAGDFAALGAEFGPAVPARRAELIARLKLWRIRDHGRVTELAHTG